jgi:hypothetical protein
VIGRKNLPNGILGKVGKYIPPPPPDVGNCVLGTYMPLLMVVTKWREDIYTFPDNGSCEVGRFMYFSW